VKKIVIALVLLSLPAMAEEEPKTVIMPAPLVVQMENYLTKQPLGESLNLFQSIRDCLQVQVPVNGVIASHGQCQTVTEEVNRRAAEEAKLNAADKKVSSQPPHVMPLHH
jgi:hypothetical protein